MVYVGSREVQHELSLSRTWRMRLHELFLGLIRHRQGSDLPAFGVLDRLLVVRGTFSVEAEVEDALHGLYVVCAR